MSSFSLKTMLFALLLCTFSCAMARHLKVGQVTQVGTFSSPEGLRQFSTTAQALRPIVSWEDLVEDGVKVEDCTSSNIRFLGNVDSSDFVKGTVVTFPKEEYLGMGCPLPPMDDELTKVDEVIFREIQISSPKNDEITVKTEFISGAEVVPEVDLNIGELVSTSRQLSSSSSTDLSLGSVSRANSIGTPGFTRQGTETIFTGATVDWRFSVNAGLSKFKFKRRSLQVSWKQSFSADASAQLDFQAAIKKQKKGEIFQAGIPGAGFSKKIFLVGRVTIGFSAGIDYEASLEVGAAATARFEGGITSGQKVTLGIRKFDVSPLQHNSRASEASLDFKGSASASAFVDGFLGLRPFVEAGAKLPLIGSANVNFGGTVGLNANVRFNSVPFRPVTSGPTIGVCDNCHSVQGTLDIEGRRLSVSAKVPLLSKKEIVIINKFLDFRVGTLCLFSTTCPAITPSPSRTPLPVDKCLCKCQHVLVQDTSFCNNPSCGEEPCILDGPGEVLGFKCCPVIRP